MNEYQEQILKTGLVAHRILFAALIHKVLGHEAGKIFFDELLKDKNELTTEFTEIYGILKNLPVKK